MCQSQEEFYKNVKKKCWPMIQILPSEKTDSVFVNSILQFWRDYDLRQNTPEQFKEHRGLLENARQGYKYDELGDAASGIVVIKQPLSQFLTLKTRVVLSMRVTRSHLSLVYLVRGVVESFAMLYQDLMSFPVHLVCE